MRFSQRFAAVLLAGAISVSLAVAASAAPGQRGQRGQRAGRAGAAIPPALLTKLNLTSEQQEKIRTAAAAYQADLQKAQGLSTPQEKRQAARQAQQTYQTAVRSTLTTEQQTQLTAMLAEAREYRGLGGLGSQLVGLNLTAEQKTKVKEISAKYEPELQKLRASQRNATDRAAVRTQMRELNQKIQSEVKAVLTTEQQQKLQTRPARRARRNGA